MDRLVDNPDQRLTSDINAFTDTALSLFLVILSSVTDLVSFSGILYQIYPPLFLALFTYAVGGTALSLRLGQPLIPLNFNQERREADFRYSLVRLRENSERSAAASRGHPRCSLPMSPHPSARSLPPLSILLPPMSSCIAMHRVPRCDRSVAFFGGERIEGDKLQARLRAAVENLTSLLVVQRNLSFFTSFYRYLIILLPTAVVRLTRAASSEPCTFTLAASAWPPARHLWCCRGEKSDPTKQARMTSRCSSPSGGAPLLQGRD